MKLEKLIGLANAIQGTPSVAVRRLAKGKYADFRGVFGYREFLEMKRFAKICLTGRFYDLVWNTWSGEKVKTLPLP